VAWCLDKHRDTFTLYVSCYITKYRTYVNSVAVQRQRTVFRRYACVLMSCIEIKSRINQGMLATMHFRI